jgi:hypothetical protein
LSCGQCWASTRTTIWNGYRQSIFEWYFISSSRWTESGTAKPLLGGPFATPLLDMSIWESWCPSSVESCSALWYLVIDNQAFWPAACTTILLLHVHQIGRKIHAEYAKD